MPLQGEPEPLRPAGEFTFSALNGMSDDELVMMAQALPTDGKLYDRYLSRLREAIVAALYKRNVTQPQIAKIINKSPQRVSQILGAYYDRIEQAWVQERAQWKKRADERL